MTCESHSWDSEYVGSRFRIFCIHCPRELFLSTDPPREETLELGRMLAEQHGWIDKREK